MDHNDLQAAINTQASGYLSGAFYQDLPFIALDIKLQLLFYHGAYTTMVHNLLSCLFLLLILDSDFDRHGGARASTSAATPLTLWKCSSRGTSASACA